MGRQAYITRLALGRSAYQAPESTQSGAEESSTDTATNEPHAVPPESNAEERGYVQSYDARGHPANPEAKSMARTLIKAQNDVLATVGVCVGIGPDGKLADGSTSLSSLSPSEQRKVRMVMTENEIGLFIRPGFLCLAFLGFWGVGGLRNRLQVFRPFSAIPFSQMLKVQWLRSGAISLLCAGLPAFAMDSLVHLVREVIQTGVIDFVMWRVGLSGLDTKKKVHLSRLMLLTCKVVDFAAFILVSPLRMYSILQVLHLLPARPILPPLRTFNPFSPSSPLPPSPFTGKAAFDSFLSLANLFILSPPVLLWIHTTAVDALGVRIFAFIRRRLSQPDNPDPFSIKGAAESDLDEYDIPGLGQLPTENISDSPPSSLLESLKGLRDYLQNVFLPTPTSTQGPSQDPLSNEFTLPTDEADQDLLPVRPTTPPPISRSPPSVHSHNSNDDTYSPRNTSPTRSASPSISSPPSSPPQNTVRVSSTREGNAETVTMEVEIAGGESTALPLTPAIPTSNNTALPEPAITFPAQPTTAATATATATADPAFLTATPQQPQQQQQQQQTHHHSARIAAEIAAANAAGTHPANATSSMTDSLRPRHRVTALSSDPAHTLALFLSNCLATWAMLPLETLLVRRLALSFLAAPGPASHQRAAAAFFRDMIWAPRWGSATDWWLVLRRLFTRGSAGGAGASVDDDGWALRSYAGRILLACGLEAAVGWSIWEGTCLGTVWLGRRWFGWGQF
ncbi:MAG: hypothetical protein M1819_002249 [Sarea resinae]|nr:MAG: hypothetical protein M1819_002249 [Sarea resinae]